MFVKHICYNMVLERTKNKVPILFIAVNVKIGTLTYAIFLYKIYT